MYERRYESLIWNLSNDSSRMGDMTNVRRSSR